MGFGETQDISSLAARITEVATPLCHAENIELVHIECVQNQKENIVRLYIDKTGGIKLDDCVYISRQLGDLIDVNIDNFGSYRLEVSSPGPNRPLKNKENLERFKGRKVKIETSEPVEEQKKFTGVIDQINNDSIVIDFDGRRVEILYIMISKATLADC
jgi:ribosome maturation factor RimP